MRPPRVALAGAIATLLAGSAQGAAQSLDAAGLAPPPASAVLGALERPTGFASPRQDAATPLRPMLLSLVLPGAGQHVLGRNRKWVFLALEAVGWSLWAERRAAGADYRSRYRDFAWDEARLGGGPRVDGSFPYYETMAHWPRSGAFDRDGAAPGVQPELDATTYNGWIWTLAAGLHLPGGSGGEGEPGYASALAYYEARAYGDPYLWDWGSDPAARTELTRLISESDRRFRHANNVVGAILANHLVAAIDAFLTARGLAAPAELLVRPAGVHATGWSAVLTLPAPR